MMKKLEELRKMLTSLKPLSIYSANRMGPAFDTFLHRATWLIYLSSVVKLNEDMLILLGENLSLLIEETEMEKMCLNLVIIYQDDSEWDRLLSDGVADIDVSLSLLRRQEEYHTGTINETVLKDQIVSLKHSIEFLKWFPRIYKDADLERRIKLLAGNLKKKLKWLTFKPGDYDLSIDFNSAYADLREEMKNLIINPSKDKDSTVSQEEFIGIDYLRSTNDFLFKKITTLITSNCKANQIDSLKNELEDLWKMLTILKPLVLFVEHNLFSFCNRGKLGATLLTIHQKATFLVYLSYIGKVDLEMMISVREINVRDMYIMILNEELFSGFYIEEGLYLLENVILLLKSNINSLDEANSNLYEVLIDIHFFILSLSRNVMLRKLHLLHSLCQDILRHSIPIICSCYLEHTEVDISSELNCVLEKINHIKSESQEIKLYYFPRVDDLGFLEFFSGYLEDLMKNQEMSIKEDIDALHDEVHSVLSLGKVRSREELNESPPWNEIINLAYQAEYIIGHHLASSSRGLGLISSLSKIIEQLKNIRKDVYGLSCKSLPAQDAAVTSRSQVLGATTQISYNHAIVGLLEESIIREYLLNGDNELDVISIIGMAGVGKTTLASTLYNTDSMAGHFDILAWCTVSQSYQNRDVLFKILDQDSTSAKTHKNICDNEELADHFCRRLRRRRYLIVLDDVWDTALWNYLKRYLPDDRNGSRILITTRNKDVADQIGSKVNELNGLSDEKSWELFQKSLIEKESLSDDLEKISKRIVEHCKGLPLSIVIIAGTLSSTERTEKQWNQIADCVTSLVLSDAQRGCKAILELSYNHLPNHLQSCFLSLGSFPEDADISVDYTVQLWICEGFVRDTKSDSAEEVARKYIEDLTVKSLVMIPTEERSRGGIKTLRLHDLLRDFCLDKAKEKHFFTVVEEINHSWPLQDPRRLIINEFPFKYLGFSGHGIRSLISYDLWRYSSIELLDMVLLQILWLRGNNSHFVLERLSSLVHLRFLAFDLVWRQKNSVIPVSICKLKNLRILNINSEENVLEVPDFIWTMVKLRHVHISRASFQIDSNRLENSSFLLENLRSLSDPRVSWDDSKWLSKLTRLQKLICVFMDDDQTKGDSVRKGDSATEGDDVTEKDGVTKEDVVAGDDDNKEGYRFRMLSFNIHLTSLNISNAAGSKQRFIRTCELPISLQKLTLAHFYLKSNDISEIGRTHKQLKVFEINSGHVPSGYEWNVDNDDFPELKVLKLKVLAICKWNASEDSFPNLEQLWVEYCKELDEIPLDFGSLPKLRLISVIDCAPSVEYSAREIEQQQHEEQNTEIRVRIQHTQW